MLLIVDDNEHLLRAQKRTARSHIECHTATTIREALVIANQWNVTAAIVDWCLPDGDGMAVIAHLREKDVVCALTTGATPNSDVTAQLGRLDAAVYLKPFAEAALLDFIRRARVEKSLDEACRKFRLTTRQRDLVHWRARANRNTSFAKHARDLRGDGAYACARHLQAHGLPHCPRVHRSDASE